jgi:hypothetical protein
MTATDVRERLDEIRRIAGDDEAAHGAQDALFREVLTAIATGTGSLRNARRIAADALTVDEIEFGRWMA